MLHLLLKATSHLSARMSTLVSMAAVSTVSALANSAALVSLTAIVGVLAASVVVALVADVELFCWFALLKSRRLLPYCLLVAGSL